MGHIGLTPQSVNIFGGFKVQGKDKDAARRLVNEAKEIEKAGAFAIVLECVPEKLAELISKEINIPTIGIGAGSSCDGQILVYQDMLGMFNDFTPKFVKKYADIKQHIINAVKSFRSDVLEDRFPKEEYSFNIKGEELEKFKNMIER